MSNVDRWVQITTAVSILIGLGLVIWELQQVKTLARAQLTSDSIAIYNDIRTAILGEQASHVIAKACLNPESLTPGETVVVHHYYLAQANLLSRLVIHTDRDGVYPAGYWQEQMWYLNPITRERVWTRVVSPVSYWMAPWILGRSSQSNQRIGASDLRNKISKC